MSYPWGRLLLAGSLLVIMVAADGTDKVLGPAPPEEVLESTPDDLDRTPLPTEATHQSTEEKSLSSRNRSTTQGNVPAKILSVPTTATSTSTPASSTKSTRAATSVWTGNQQALKIAKKMCSEYSKYVNVSVAGLVPEAEYSIHGNKDHGINRNIADAGEFPFKVERGYEPPGSEEFAFLCSGSLFSPLFVFTAAPCKFVRRIRYVRWALLGSTTLNDPETKPIKIVESLKPARSPWSIYGNMALLRLEDAPPDLEHATIQEILRSRPNCVGIKDVVSDVPLGEFGTAYDVSGWWLNVQEAAEEANTLMKLSLYQVAIKKCADVYKFMAGSRSLKCGTELTASAYTNVHYHWRWIISNVWPEEQV